MFVGVIFRKRDFSQNQKVMNIDPRQDSAKPGAIDSYMFSAYFPDPQSPQRLFQNKKCLGLLPSRSLVEAIEGEFDDLQRGRVDQNPVVVGSPKAHALVLALLKGGLDHAISQEHVP